MRQKSSDYDKSFFITRLKEKTFQKQTFFCFYFVGLSHCRSNHEIFVKFETNTKLFENIINACENLLAFSDFE